MFIGDIIKTDFQEKDLKEKKKKRDGGKRGICLQEIFDVYSDERQIILRKKENWRRYILFLKLNVHQKDSKENQKLFKKWNPTDKEDKKRKFIKEVDIKGMAYFASHIPTDDMPFVVSIAKDKLARNESFMSWFMAARSNEQTDYKEYEERMRRQNKVLAIKDSNLN